MSACSGSPYRKELRSEQRACSAPMAFRTFGLIKSIGACPATGLSDKDHGRRRRFFSARKLCLAEKIQIAERSSNLSACGLARLWLRSVSA